MLRRKPEVKCGCNVIYFHFVSGARSSYHKMTAGDLNKVWEVGVRYAMLR